MTRWVASESRNMVGAAGVEPSDMLIISISYTLVGKEVAKKG